MTHLKHFTQWLAQTGIQQGLAIIIGEIISWIVLVVVLNYPIIVNMKRKGHGINLRQILNQNFLGAKQGLLRGPGGELRHSPYPNPTVWRLFRFTGSLNW